ncbi:MAG: sugar phosphate isomerase/epimerase [Clostridiales bacterium]|jgi:sugar phosphate isomerase/epimerase|nr:sugar phosphate isomerase/epimerase [Clostridiales bacterium]
MKISTQTETTAQKLGEETAIKYIAQAGFDAADFSMFGMHDNDDMLNRDNFREYVKRLKSIADDCGIYFNQSHAPFPSYRQGEEEYNKLTYDRIIRAMEISSILGVDIMVVHPTHISEKENFDFNVKFFKSLQPYCEKFGVRVALENMWGTRDGKKVPNVCSVASDFIRHLDALDRRYFVGCLDLGHCGLVGEDAAEMIRALGHDRLKALHVHDNDFIDDLHYYPFSGKMDWVSITKALADINYDGVFTLEADGMKKRMPVEFLPKALSYLYDAARQLTSMIESAANKT